MATDVVSVQAAIAIAMAFAGSLAFVQFVYVPWVYSEASFRLRRLSWEMKRRSGFVGKLPESPQEYAAAMQKADSDRKTVLVYCMGLDLAERDIRSLSLWKVVAILAPAALHSTKLRSNAALSPSSESVVVEEPKDPEIGRLRDDVLKKALLILAFRMIACSFLASVIVVLLLLCVLARDGLNGVTDLADRIARILRGVWSPENVARDRLAAIWS